jgi:hypothetical protein
MTRRETSREDDGSSYVKCSQDSGLVLQLSALAWETKFFGRRLGRLEMEGEGIYDVEATAVDQALEDTLSFGDEEGSTLFLACLSARYEMLTVEDTPRSEGLPLTDSEGQAQS